MRKTGFTLMLVLTFTLHFQAKAQNLYVAGDGPDGYVLGQFNLETCTFCEEFVVSYDLFPGGLRDVVALPNGNVVAVGSNGDIIVFNPPSSTPISTFDVPGSILLAGAVLAPNGNVYVTGYEVVNGEINPKVYEYNPVTNSVTVVGSLPAPIYQVLIQPFFWNGVLYAFMSDASNPPDITYHLVSIQLGNPMVIEVIYTYPTLCGSASASISSGPYAGIYTGNLQSPCTGNNLYSFDLPDNTTNLECAVSPYGYGSGMGEVPPGFPASACQCPTDAGNVPTANATLCANQTFPFTNTGGFLDNNDIKRYILFSNPADTLGSIVATSATPSFTFNPTTMQTGVTYYAAAIAGNNLNGNVDLNDPCLDISNAAQVVWRPLPTVVFSAANPNVCAGACTTVTATFTGIAPFTLTYTTPASGTVTQTFSGNTGTFQVCTTVGSTPGSLVVQATKVVDAFCTCN